MKLIFLLLILALPSLLMAQTKAPVEVKSPKGVLLEDLTWLEAEKLLNDKTIVVIPIGAAAKEHGPHLKLKNDFLIAEYLKKRVLTDSQVIIAPTVNYNFYPAFLEYPGSTSLRLETARDLIIDICHNFSTHGVRRFYVINTGVSTRRPLKAASEQLISEGILLDYTDIIKIAEPVEKEIKKQEGGTHADEIETSIMLYITPDQVDMSKAVKDYSPDKGPLTRNPNNAQGTYSKTGIWGDPTLATKEKGQKIVEAIVSGILRDIEILRTRELPKPHPPEEDKKTPE
ncbi:MAG: creatininase family protein [Acidobacteria bacterium]|nr:creatininase family protein [Acidobacteriota bacterium]